MQLGISIRDLDLLTIGMVNDMFVESRNDEYKDEDRLPRRRILTGSDLMKCGDRMFQKGYNGFIKVGTWRRFLFMKKGINKSILFYIASVLFLVASAIDFTSGNENSMAIVWLCLGSSFLCLGSTHKKKENNTDDK